MKNFDWKKLLPHVLAVGIFLLVALIYCKPIMQGLVVNQTDNQQWRAMAQQSFEYKEKFGHLPLWTNSMFSGMPAYQIAVEPTQPVTNLYLSYLFTFGLPKPLNFFFLACFSFYILLMVLRINPLIGIMGALAYAYSTYDPIIIAVGHDTKMLAIGYAPLVIGGLLLLFQKKYWFGAALLTSGFALQASTSHLQIVYYTLLIAAAATISYIIISFTTKDYKDCFLSIAIAIACGLIAFASNAINLLPTYDYSKESIRGGQSELKNTKDNNSTASGLDKDYAFRWSYGISETFTLMVPGILGGSQGGNEYNKSTFADKLTEVGYPEDQALSYANGISYWGDQPFTSGPVYIGAVICFLFIAGMFLIDDWNKWWLIAASIFAIILAWGKNFQALNYFFFDYLPLYKKFRAPAMSLVIVQFCFPVLAAMTLQKILFAGLDKATLLKKLKPALYTTGAILGILIVCYFTFSYSAAGDKAIQENFTKGMLQQQGAGNPGVQQQAQEFGKSFITAIKEDRRSLFGKDLLRTVFLIAAAGGLIYFFIQKRISPKFVLVGVLILSSFDLFAVGRRYFNARNFVEPENFEGAFTPSPADVEIRKDKSYYRVFNQTTDAFQDALTSYHHNSIGGYHPAKLTLYNDIIENQLSKGNMQVINMLNTKYFISPGAQNQPTAQVNPGAFGPCWLVKGIKYVADGRQEMNALNNTNLRDTVVIQQKFRDKVLPIKPDPTASINFIRNSNDTVRYHSESGTNKFAVLSEVYYEAGWNAYIDGKKSDYCKVDYVLRGISIPAGKHDIVFIFEPKVYSLSNTITLWGCIALYLMILGAVVVYLRQNKRNMVKA
ncbi:MAG TPA: YfhO family protein [Segetibacter sp.]|nr:YfhO family protein [Segetibacter sp.]